MKTRVTIFFVVLALGLSANAQTGSQTFFKKFSCLMTTEWTDNDLKQFLDKNGFEMRYILPNDIMRFATNITDGTDFEISLNQEKNQGTIGVEFPNVTAFLNWKVALNDSWNIQDSYKKTKKAFKENIVDNQKPEMEGDLKIQFPDDVLITASWDISNSNQNWIKSLKFEFNDISKLTCVSPIEKFIAPNFPPEGFSASNREAHHLLLGDTMSLSDIDKLKKYYDWKDNDGSSVAAEYYNTWFSIQSILEEGNKREIGYVQSIQYEKFDTVSFLKDGLSLIFENQKNSNKYGGCGHVSTNLEGYTLLCKREFGEESILFDLRYNYWAYNNFESVTLKFKDEKFSFSDEEEISSYLPKLGCDENNCEGVGKFTYIDGCYFEGSFKYGLFWKGTIYDYKNEAVKTIDAYQDSVLNADKIQAKKESEFYALKWVSTMHWKKVQENVNKINEEFTAFLNSFKTGVSAKGESRKSFIDATEIRYDNLLSTLVESQKNIEELNDYLEEKTECKNNTELLRLKRATNQLEIYLRELNSWTWNKTINDFNTDYLPKLQKFGDINASLFSHLKPIANQFNSCVNK